MFLDIFRTRFRQGNQTMSYPSGPAPLLPERFAGMPLIDQKRCRDCPCSCINSCPTRAILKGEGKIKIDMGRCIFCRTCERGCPSGAIRFSKQYRLAAANRGDLIIDGTSDIAPNALNNKAAGLCERSFSLRVVSAGGCGACEADTNVLNTLAWDISRFGIHYVASPRHADGLLLLGPVTENMAFAVKETYEAIPSPKFVIASGACAISGGIYADHPECHIGKDTIVPVDLFIPGCPPHPLTILDALLRFLGQE